MAGLAPTLLDRDIARAQIDPIRRLGDPLLRQVIDEGVAVFERCNQSAPDGDVNLGVLFPFQHILEMADGAQILLAESGVTASQPVLRSAFEALVGLKYVLSNNTEVKALCYVVADLKDRIRWYDSMDPTTDHGRRYREDVGIENKPGFPIPAIDDVRRARSQLEGLLLQPPYREHADEYDRLLRARKRRPHWYSLYDGPASFRELTSVTGDLDDFVILYGQWSKTTHAVDLARQLGREGGVATIQIIRAPDGIEQRYLFAIYFVLEATRRVLQHYRPGELERYARWYKQSVSVPLERLEQIETD